MKQLKQSLDEIFSKNAPPFASADEYQKIWAQIQKRRLSKKDILFFSLSLTTAILCLIFIVPEKQQENLSSNNQSLYIYDYDSPYGLTY